MSQEEFQLWLRSRYSGSFWIGGHRFEKTDTEDIRIDNGLFKREEAEQIFRMLSSRNPFTRLNAGLFINERNGRLLLLLGIVAVLLLVIILIRAAR